MKSVLTDRVIVGVDALRVVSIEDESRLADRERADALDLLAHLRLGQLDYEEERRVLLVTLSGRGARHLPLIVGEQVRIERLSPAIDRSPCSTWMVTSV